MAVNATVNELQVIISAKTDQLNKALKTTKKQVEDTKDTINGTKKTINGTSKSFHKSLSFSERQMRLFNSRMIRRFSLAAIAVRLIIKAVETFTKLLNNGLSNVYKYSQAIGGDFAKNIDGLRDSLSYYGNSLATVFVPTLNAILPLLSKLLDKLASFNNILAESNAYLNGQATYLKAVKVEGVETVNSLLQQYNKLKRSVAGFDELNIINNNNNVMDMFELKETEVEKPLNEYLDRSKEVGGIVKEVLLNGWEEIKQRLETLVEKFKPAIEKVKGWFNEVKDLFSGIFDPTQWGIMSPFYGIDFALDSETLDAIINAIPTALDLWVQLSTKAKDIFQKIGETVKDIVTTLTKPIDNAIADLINSIVKWYEEEGGKEWLDKVGEDIKGIVAKVDEAWQKVKPTFERIGGKLTKMWEEHLKPFLKSVIDMLAPLWEIFKTYLEGKIDNNIFILFLEWLGDTLESFIPILNLIFDILTSINKILKPIFNIMVDIISLDFGSMKEHLKELILNLFNIGRDLFVDLVNVIIGSVNRVIFAVRDAINYIVDGINNITKIFGWDPIGRVDWQGIPEMEKVSPITEEDVKKWLPSNQPSNFVGYSLGPVAPSTWNASDYFDTSDSGALNGSQNIILEVDGQALGRASLTNINRLSRQTGYVNLNL